MTNEESKPKRKGRISDEEARIIEKTLPFSTYEEVAAKLNREASTVRKFAQRNGISKDKISTQKHAANNIKKDPVFKKLEDYLDDDELVKAHSVYMEFNEQFGGDIFYSEKQEIIDLAILSCLVDRELSEQKKIQNTINQNTDLKAKLQKAYKESKFKMDDEDDDSDDLLDEIDDLDVQVADLKEERKHVKDTYRTYMDRKEKLMKSLNATRQSRSDELVNASQNFGNLIQYFQKHTDKRKELGLDIEKMRLGIKEEYIRLSDLHKYVDGALDFPIFNSEVALREQQDRTKQILENQVLDKDKEEEDKDEDE